MYDPSTHFNPVHFIIITNVLTCLTFADSVPNLKKRFGEAIFSKSKGNPGLVYESRLVNSFEPTGVPVS
jgi:hypothetical protein